MKLDQRLRELTVDLVPSYAADDDCNFTFHDVFSDAISLCELRLSSGTLSLVQRSLLQRNSPWPQTMFLARNQSLGCGPLSSFGSSRLKNVTAFFRIGRMSSSGLSSANEEEEARNSDPDRLLDEN